MAADELTLEVGVESGKAQSALEELIALTRQLVDKTGNVAPALQPAQGVVQTLKNSWRELSAVVAGAGVTAALVSIADSARDIRQTATALHLTTRGLQTLDYAAEQSGVSIDSTRSALQALQGQITSAALGEQGAMTNLGFLGLSRQELESMDASERFSRVAESLRKIQDPARRTGVAMRVFGGAAADLQPLLAKTPDELRKMAKEFDELGGGLGSDQIEGVAAWDKQMSKMRVGLTSLRASLAQTVLPVLSALSTALSGIAKWFQDVNRSAKGLEVAGIAVVVAGIMKLVSVLRGAAALDLNKSFMSVVKWLGIAVAIAAVALVVQDLIHMFQGGRSVIAEFIDKFAGLGTADRMVRNIKAGWKEMSEMRFPGISDMLEALNHWQDTSALKERIADQKQWLQNHGRNQRDPVVMKVRKELEENESKLFGSIGIRAVGRGLGSDAQRSGELTTGKLSRFEGGPGSVTINNEIKVEAAAGTRETADAARRGVTEANRTLARDLRMAIGKAGK